MVDIGCGNDRARSMQICHAKRETTIRVYDGETASSNNGAWAEVYILKDLEYGDDCETISTFEKTATYENYEVNNKVKGNLDGKVSSFEVFYGK